MLTKQLFLSELKAGLLAVYPWAADEAKLARFMAGVEVTLSGEKWTWNHDGAAVLAVWKRHGGKGKPTMKALRALP